MLQRRFGKMLSLARAIVGASCQLRLQHRGHEPKPTRGDLPLWDDEFSNFAYRMYGEAPHTLQAADFRKTVERFMAERSMKSVPTT